MLQKVSTLVVWLFSECASGDTDNYIMQNMLEYGFSLTRIVPSLFA